MRKRKIDLSVRSLEVIGVKKSFKDTRVLKGIDLSVGPGEIFSLVGPNGAGKTTTVRIILGTLFPDQGSVRIMGLDSVTDRPRALQQVGFMLERPCINVSLTLDENLRIYSSIYGLESNGRRIDEVVEIADLVKWRSTTLSRYSKGMLQKAALCRALLHDPALLILDEPASGMDPILQEELRGILVRLRDEGKSIFLCSHDLLQVERMCTHVGVLKEGRIVKGGAIDEVRSSCTFAKYRLKWKTNDEAVAAKKAMAAFSIVRSDGVENAAFTVLVNHSTSAEELLVKIEQKVSRPETVEAQELSLSDVFFYEVKSEQIEETSSLV
jgi:ABC-2 type transport system ATP-binding protein